MTNRRAAIHHRSAGEILSEHDLVVMHRLYLHAREAGCDVVAAAFDTPTGDNYDRLFADFNAHRLDVIFVSDGEEIRTDEVRIKIPNALAELPRTSHARTSHGGAKTEDIIWSDPGGDEIQTDAALDQIAADPDGMEQHHLKKIFGED